MGRHRVSDEDARRRIRMLVLDDDTDICDLILDVAEGVGLTVEVTADRDAFLDAYRRMDPTIILLDLHMPGSDGVELLNELHQAGSRAQIILMSGFDRRVLKSSGEYGLSRGLSIAATLEKPFAIEGLESLLLEVAELADARQTRHSQPTGSISALELAPAIAGGGLFLRYQPKLRLGTEGRPDHIHGVEALVRWQHPTRGEVPPAQFIGLAEQSGLIEELTDFVFRQALTQAAQWQQAGLPLSVAVNLSPLLLGDVALPDRLASLAQEAGLPPARLIVEVTESAVMRDASAAMSVLTRFRLNGFGLSLDDFGTGYSSLIELYRMPFNELKIDRAFVAQVAQQEEARVIVGALSRLSHDLGLTACAEGAEDWDTVQFLRAVGCDEVQGYVISRPLKGADIPDLLLKTNPSWRHRPE